MWDSMVDLRDYNIKYKFY